MPTPSHRRTRSRVEPQVSSPELPNKRRKMDPVSTLSQPLTDYQVNTIVSSLHAPSNDVVAAHDHANDKNARDHRDGVTAYAKICGRDWTYYVKDLKITLGRPPDSRPPGPPPAQSDVDIDLGPSKLVSRGHATIQYDSTEHRCWTIEVLGRNGIRVDDDQHKRGAIVQLRSGSMFEIAGVQMLFVLPDQSPTVVDSIFRRAHDPQAEYAGDGDSQETNLQSTQLSSETTFPNSQRKSHLPKSLPESQPQRTHPMQEVAASDLSMTSYSAPNERPSAPAVTPQRNSHASPGYHRGLMLESTEDIDYSLDSSKEIKPPYSYANLIAQAILSTEDQKLTLAHIYAWIQTNYAFYRFAASGWQNSIRHNLSLNKAFQKVPRRTDEPGKGMKWQIAPDYLEEYTKKIKKTPQTKQNRLLSPRVSSPITNSTKRSSINVQKITSATGHTSPRRSATPPTAFGVGVVTPKEAFTPDRGSRASMKTKSGQNQPLSPTRPGGRASSPFIDEYSNSGTAITPAPQKHNPHLAPPSVNQLPSSYLPTSSPAPFWKYVNFLTPGRPDFSSPIKSPQLRSSSPPAPVRQISNRLREAGSPIKDKDNIFRGNHESTRLDPPAVPTTSADDDMGDNDTDDLAGIDLSRGFQKIGKFHAQHAIARSSQMKPRGTQAAV